MNQLPISDVPRARWSDPDTSRQAAESIPLPRVTERLKPVFLPRSSDHVATRNWSTALLICGPVSG